jgi:sugar phosphate isomerase/epimerase
VEISPLYSLSTSWNRDHFTSAAETVAACTALGFRRLELGSSTSAERLAEYLPLVEAGAIGISSLHCPCPRPAELLRGEVKEPWLSAMDPAEREFAVRLVCATLDAAERLGAGVVVLHVGRLQSPAWEESFKLLRQIQTALRDGLTPSDGPVAERISTMRRLREENVAVQYPGLFAALEQVAEHAGRRGVKVGLETRLHYPEIPFEDEYVMLLERFAGSGIGYWHDTGHAQEQEIEGFGNHRRLLERLGGAALGAHLHDVIYPWPDHQPPGCGIVDWAMVTSLLNPAALRVMEVMTIKEINNPITPERIVAGLQHLRNAFGD